MRRFGWIVGLIALFGALVWALHARAQVVGLTSTPATRATITIPSAAVLTAQATPVQLLPAASGFVYVVSWAEITLAFNSAAYSSTACGLYYHGTTQLALSANLNSTVDGSASATGIVAGLSTGNIAAANINGLGVDFACTSSNPTTGNSPLKIVIDYVAVPL